MTLREFIEKNLVKVYIPYTIEDIRVIEPKFSEVFLLTYLFSDHLIEDLLIATADFEEGLKHGYNSSDFVILIDFTDNVIKLRVDIADFINS